MRAHDEPHKEYKQYRECQDAINWPKADDDTATAVDCEAKKRNGAETKAE